ncbi:putative F-box protein At5g66830 [Cornus florida]|uniref:putative F-box protein At5g66830 n=1 Tax=Cornus florida TaxID=4283 RepID=UPI0028A2BCB6|nr:putative F-box protein At5g66830 [Cornus florida]
MANNNSKKNYYSCWSDLLPQEMLELIMARVATTMDLLRCRSVCHSWRSAAVRFINNNGVAKSSTFTPLLLLYSNKNLYDDDSKLLCLGRNTTMEYRFRRPKMRRLPYKDNGPEKFTEGRIEFTKAMESVWRRDDSVIDEEAEAVNSGSGVAIPRRTTYVAPHRGWLLLYSSRETALYLFNPFSRMVVQLPPPPPRPIFYDPTKLNFISSSILTDPTCMLYVYTTNSHINLREITMYRFSDKEWTPVFTRNYICCSMIFYQGNFYSVDWFGVLRRCLFDKSYSNYKEEEVCNVTSTNNPFRYLVESWFGELLMVVRNHDFYRDSNGKSKRRTKSFEIFKLNWSNGKWEKVRNFGDQALFLARNDSKFISVRNNPDYKPNSIYFIEDANSWNEDFGVYNLENSEIEPLNLSHEQMQYSYYRWFQPVL